MRFQPIYEIASVCHQLGITQAVLCPGSRCAPLTLAFTRHPQITSRTFSDERSAGFVALGMTLETRKPTVLVCTSGTAAYNFAPAITEAFYLQQPLLVLTADRPGHLIDQWDGQTIHQEGLYGKHVKCFEELPENFENHAEEIIKIVSTAIEIATTYPCGPVHINCPFSEPLYPPKGAQIKFSAQPIASQASPSFTLTNDLVQKLNDSISQYHRVLMVVGQQSDVSADLVENFCKQHSIPVVGDVISNLHAVPAAIRHADAFLKHTPPATAQALRPNLLITFGKSVISKNLKHFLRQQKPEAHWYIHPTDGHTPDPFQSLTKVVPCQPEEFLKTIKPVTTPGFDQQQRKNFKQIWEDEEHQTDEAIQNHFRVATQDEFSLAYDVLCALPQPCNLHLANSMSVRYANFIGLPAQHHGVQVHSNRGTSGIDGCTSTSVGHSLLSKNPTVLITGDLAFFYDRNAFWHNYAMPDLRVVVLNNHGGSIFGIIDGPADLPEAREYFMTRQRLTAGTLCEEFDFDYLPVNDLKERRNLLKEFFEMDGRTKIMEIQTDHAVVTRALNSFMNQIKKNYEA